MNGMKILCIIIFSSYLVHSLDESLLKSSILICSEYSDAKRCSFFSYAIFKILNDFNEMDVASDFLLCTFVDMIRQAKLIGLDSSTSESDEIINAHVETRWYSVIWGNSYISSMTAISIVRLILASSSGLVFTFDDKIQLFQVWLSN